MERFDAVKMAAQMEKAGVPANAESRHGMTGTIWGVRAQGSEDVYERQTQVPGWWRRLLAALEVVEMTAQAEARHRGSCRRTSSPCHACMSFTEVVQGCEEYLIWVREHPEED